MTREKHLIHFVNLFSANLITAFSQFFSVILLIQWIGYQLFAQYSVTTATLVIISSVTSLGWENYFPFFLKRKEKCIESYLITASIIQIFQFITAMIVLSLVGFLNSYYDLNYFIIVFTVICRSFLESKLNYAKAYLSTLGLGQPEKNAKFVSAVIQLSSIFIFSLIDASLFMLFTAIVGPLFVEYVLLMFSINSHSKMAKYNPVISSNFISPSKSFGKSYKYIKNQFSVIFPYWLNIILNSFSSSFDIIFCQYLGLSDKSISSYSFAKSGFSFIGILPFTAYRTALARFDNEKYTVQHYLTIFKKKMYLLASILVAACILGALLIKYIDLFVNSIPDVVIGAVPLFIILVFGIFGQALMNIAYLRLHLIGKHLVFNFSHPAKALVLLLLLLLLANIYGVQGVAASVSLSLILVGLSLFLIAENVSSLSKISFLSSLK